MSRIRTVKPELFKHEDLFDAEYTSKLPLRLAFIGLFTVADKEGRFKWRPRTLKLDVLPHDLLDFSEVLDALEQAGFIRRYEVGGEIYGWIPTFGKHQRFSGKEASAKSLLPPPPDCPASDQELEQSASMRPNETRSEGEVIGKHRGKKFDLQGKLLRTQERNKGKEYKERNIVCKGGVGGMSSRCEQQGATPVTSLPHTQFSFPDLPPLPGGPVQPAKTQNRVSEPVTPSADNGGYLAENKTADEQSGHVPAPPSRGEGPSADNEPDRPPPRSGTQRRGRKPKILLAEDWTPADSTYALLTKGGIPETFSASCLDEFRLYWRERGEVRPGWEATFVNGVKMQWERHEGRFRSRPKTPVNFDAIDYRAGVNPDGSF